MNIYKPCYNSFCEPAATERRSKKLTDCTDAHGVFDTDFFDLCLLIYIWILNGFASVTACGWSLTTNLPNPTNIYHFTTYKIRPIRAISVRKKIYSRMNYINLTTNLPNQTNHLICRLNQKKNPSIIPFVLSRHNQNETKIKKKKIKKRIREKTP